MKTLKFLPRFIFGFLILFSAALMFNNSAGGANSTVGFGLIEPILERVFVPDINFGVAKITNKTMTYYAYAQELPGGSFSANYAEVRDTREVQTGWNLTVAQQGQLNILGGNAETKLEGAQIKFEDSVVDSASQVNYQEDIILIPEGGVPELVMKADEGEGYGKNTITWGEVNQIGGEDKNTAVNIEIPGETKKRSTKYFTSLLWTLNDAP